MNKAELQKMQDGKFYEWFEKNYPVSMLEGWLKESASEGYSACQIKLTEGVENQERWNMLNHPLFLESIKDVFPDLDVYTERYEVREFKILITGAGRYTTNHKRLVIRWGNSNE